MTTVVLVHGAFAESASWNGVIEHLRARDVDAIAVANPLRDVATDAAYLRDVLASVDGPVVLVGHSYGGMVISEAAAGSSRVAATAALMGATQRPVTAEALTIGLPTGTPAWRSIPSWFVFSDEDLNIPVALHRFMAERAGAEGVREIAGASHALSVSQPEAVAASVLEAVAAC